MHEGEDDEVFSSLTSFFTVIRKGVLGCACCAGEEVEDSVFMSFCVGEYVKKGIEANRANKKTTSLKKSGTGSVSCNVY